MLKLLLLFLAAAVVLAAPVRPTDSNSDKITPSYSRSGLRVKRDNLPKELRDQYDRYDNEEVRRKVLETLSEVELSDPKRMHLDNTGHVFVVEDMAAVSRRRSVLHDVHRMRRMFSGTAATGFTSTGVPIHHSLAGATNVIYIDFDGMNITGTQWNNAYRATTFFALPYSLDSTPWSFSTAERTAMSRIWNRIAEDYAPFNVDVTTEPPAKFGPTTGRLLITRSTGSNGATLPAGAGAGGVAYTNVFGLSNFQIYSPVFVYYNNLGRGREDYVAEASSHEMGHNLGLSHDGTSRLGYYTGGSSAWAPIMGVAYGRIVSVFNNGTYPDANNKEDDVAKIAARVGYRPDVHGNTIATASPLVLVSNTASTVGIIEQQTDTDVFAVTLTAAGTLAVSAVNFRSPANTAGANLDIAARVTTASGTVVATFSSTTSTSAVFSATISVAGTYYVWISGTGNPSATVPYPAYGSLGQYRLTTTFNASPTTTTTTRTSRTTTTTTRPTTTVITTRPTTTTTLAPIM